MISFADGCMYIYLSGSPYNYFVGEPVDASIARMRGGNHGEAEASLH